MPGKLRKRAATKQRHLRGEVAERSAGAEEPQAPAAPPARKRKRKQAKEEDACDEEEGAASSILAVGPKAAKAAEKIKAWAEEPKQLQAWLDSRGGGLEPRLQEVSGSILLLRDFMPLRIADAVLTVLENLPENAWELSEQAGEDQAADHSFYSVDLSDVPELAALRSVFWRMLPQYHEKPTLPIISAARYGKGGGIGRHDDRAHVPFFGQDEVYSRVVAAIWYLTREWSAEEGGCLLDLQADEASAEVKHVPIFNSLAAFDVPHWHAVSKVVGERYRYSIFGWWHQRGRLYDLPGGERKEVRRGKAKRKAKMARSS